MKISTGDDVAAVNEHQRIIGGGCGFDFQNLFAMRQNTAHGTMHLWHTTDAVGVLNPRIIFSVRFSNLAVLQERIQMSGDRFLSLVRSGVVQPRIKRCRRVTQTFERHCPSNIGNARKAFRARDRQSTNCVHRLSPVQQRETFFGLQLHWLQFRPLERFATVHPVSGKERFAFADQV